MRKAAAFMILAVCAAGTSTATAQDASPETLVDALQEGGHVIFVRHASTERDYAGQIDAVMGDRVARHLGTVPSAGVNTVLVGHDDPFEAATGIYPEPVGGRLHHRSRRGWAVRSPGPHRPR